MSYILVEGGNVQIGDVSAERIDLTKINREDIVKKLNRTLLVVNLRFQRKYGAPLWNPELFKSKKFLSGSAYHFFNKAIPTKDFVSVKRTVGDVDTQVDKFQEKSIEEFLNSITGEKFAAATFVGFKKSAGQFITLWSFDAPKVNIQIDLELVDFVNGSPTDWSNFSHSSAWEDMTAGVKGVFQKYIIRALTTKSLRDVIILKGKKEVPTKVTTTDLAFSVGQGLRQKLEPVMDGNTHRKHDGMFVYKEITTAKSSYTTDLKIMFEILFGVTPSKVELEMFGSYVGCLTLAKKYFSKAELLNLQRGFVFTLWGPSAQGLYRGDPTSDQEEKQVAYKKMLDFLDLNTTNETEVMRVAFYKKYPT